MVGLKYQLRLDEANLVHYSPMLVTPAWEIIKGQATAIVLFGLNLAFAASRKPRIILTNVVIVVTLDQGGGSGETGQRDDGANAGSEFSEEGGYGGVEDDRAGCEGDPRELGGEIYESGGFGKEGGCGSVLGVGEWECE